MKALGPNWRETIEGRYSPCRQIMTLRTRQLSNLVMVVSYLCLYVLGVTASCFAEPLKLMVFECVTAEMWNFTKISRSQKSPSPTKLEPAGDHYKKSFSADSKYTFTRPSPFCVVWAQKKKFVTTTLFSFFVLSMDVRYFNMCSHFLDPDVNHYY